MRLWSLHPRYLDPKGLVALWREALLAQAVLTGQTRGYRHHPQLDRFARTPPRATPSPPTSRRSMPEAVRRGYHFDAGRVGRGGGFTPLTVATGQLEYEWAHLTGRPARAPVWLRQLNEVGLPEPHPLFKVIEGGVAAWEVLSGSRIPN